MAPGNMNAIALGTFDGVHIAHRMLIKQALAAKSGGKVIAVTFDRIPGSMFGKDGKMRQIVDCQDKLRLLYNAGAEEVKLLAFDEKLYSMSPEAFFEEIIVGRYGAGLLAVGHDYRFGRGGKGDVDLLQRLCIEQGVQLLVLGEMSMGDIRISSSEIRRRIASGQSLEAAEMLGRVHSFKAAGSGGSYLADEDLALPPAGMKFKTAVFADLPDFASFDEYDFIFWLEQSRDGYVIRLQGNAPILGKREIYLLFGPRAGQV